MRRLVIDRDAPDPAVLAEAAAVIRGGGLVAYPTDTLYGLGADPRQPDGVGVIYRVKGRSEARPLPLIAGDLEQVLRVGRLSELASRLAIRFWPGPLTLVISVLADPSASNLGLAVSVAIRIPDHLVARQLALEVGHAITSTSANRSDGAATDDPEIVASELGAEIDLLLDAGRSPGGPASTIVDVTGVSPVLLRAGAVSWERVLESVAE